MSAIHLVTWNVLHRVHAVNWGEDQVASWPDEDARTAAVCARVLQFLDDGADVVVLQEASGDLLAALRERANPLRDVRAHAYPRVPRLQRPGPMPLHDPSEHLVAVAPAGRILASSGETFAQDHGKGFIAVTMAEAVVVGTHVSFGDKGVPQLARLAEVARAADRAVVVAGDINAPVMGFQQGLGAGWEVADLHGQPATRVGAGRSRSSTIDHVAVLGGHVASAQVLDAQDLSDHRPVRARVVPAVTAP